MEKQSRSVSAIATKLKSVSVIYWKLIRKELKCASVIQLLPVLAARTQMSHSEGPTLARGATFGTKKQRARHAGNI